MDHFLVNIDMPPNSLQALTENLVSDSCPEKCENRRWAGTASGFWKRREDQMEEDYTSFLVELECVNFLISKIDLKK